ncbi:MAG: tRNA (guanosine(37)-N1)-methyltransferase TrmD [Gammaproteobacteria bacterium]
MWVGIVSLFPEMLDALHYGITGRALETGLLILQHWNPRDYSYDKHRTVDDRPYGGGPGMVMKVQPLRDAIYAAKAAANGAARVVHLSPQGRLLTQNSVAELAQRERLILIAGRYEGIDERLIAAEVDEEWSIGDYVLSGGELAAMVMIDAITRLLPEALGDDQSAQQDSFTNNLLDYPHYTRPESCEIPAVLLSGDHQAIARWRLQQALGRTWLRRPDLLAKRTLTDTEQALLDEFKSNL